MNSERRIVGAILVGGKSERMGALKQELILPDGRTFVRATFDALAPLCDDVVLLGAPRTDAEHALRIDALHDAADDAGPLAGLVSLLESGRGERYLVVSCDAPLVERADLESLLSSTSEVAHFGAPAAGEKPLYLPAALSASLAARARALLEADRRALRHLYAEARVDELDVDDDARAARLRGVNTREELADLRATLDDG